MKDYTKVQYHFSSLQYLLCMDIHTIIKNCNELKPYVERMCGPDDSGTKFFKEIDYKNFLNHLILLQSFRLHYMGDNIKNWDSADKFLKKYTENITNILKHPSCKGEMKLWLKALLKRNVTKIENTLQNLKADLIYKEEINEY